MSTLPLNVIFGVIWGTEHDLSAYFDLKDHFSAQL